MKEDLKEIFNNVNDWLKFAEAKNAMLLGVNAALLFGVFKALGTANLFSQDFEFIKDYYLWVFPFFIAISLGITLFSFLPQTAMIKLGDNVKPENINVLFYTHLKTLESDDLLKELGLKENESPTAIEKSYAQQIVINSEIASNKYDSFKVASWITIFGLMFCAPALILLIFYVVKRMGKEDIK